MQSLTIATDHAVRGDLFDLMPVALWEEDFSTLKSILDGWRAEGVTDLAAHLAADPARAERCAQSINVRRVNQRALDMLGAANLAQLTENLAYIIRDESLPAYTQELQQLWDGNASFTTTTVNYRLNGSRIDVRVNGALQPDAPDWSRVIVALEDISAQEDARRDLLASEAEARALFNDSPVSIWLEDFSSIKTRLDELRNRGIVDFRTFIDVHPDFVAHCMREIHVLDVNQHTLTLFGAPDKSVLLARLNEIFRDEMRTYFAAQLAELWDGKLRHEREVLNYRLSGEALNLILQFSVMPGREQDWSKVLVSLTDITARKKAEAYLEYLGKHDVLTRLYNRSYFVDEVNRLNLKGPFPVSIILIDLNGLKAINDELGHASGDALLRRMGEILGQVVDEPGCAARIGGDEFVILLPSKAQKDVDKMLAELDRVTELNNQFHSHAPAVMFSVGTAICDAGGRMEAAIQRADMAMYGNKRALYTAVPNLARQEHL
jgi:diguanylate cyclase (GGDEF)-like protein